jgi:hypothetical protein
LLEIFAGQHSHISPGNQSFVLVTITREKGATVTLAAIITRDFSIVSPPSSIPYSPRQVIANQAADLSVISLSFLHIQESNNHGYFDYYCVQS